MRVVVIFFLFLLLLVLVIKEKKENNKKTLQQGENAPIYCIIFVHIVVIAQENITMMISLPSIKDYRFYLFFLLFTYYFRIINDRRKKKETRK